MPQPWRRDLVGAEVALAPAPSAISTKGRVSRARPSPERNRATSADPLASWPGGHGERIAAGEDAPRFVEREDDVAGAVAGHHRLPHLLQIDQRREHAAERGRARRPARRPPARPVGARRRAGSGRETIACSGRLSAVWARISAASRSPLAKIGSSLSGRLPCSMIRGVRTLEVGVAEVRHARVDHVDEGAVDLVVPAGAGTAGRAAEGLGHADAAPSPAPPRGRPPPGRSPRPAGAGTPAARW